MKERSINFDQFFNLSKDMICYIRPDGFFERVNPAWSLQFGWTQEEYLSIPVIEFLHPDDRSRISEALIRAMEGHVAIAFENRFRCKDDTYKWISWNAYFLPDQNCVFALTYDITAGKQAAEMLGVIRADLETRLQQQAIDLKKIQHKLSVGEKQFNLLEQSIKNFAIMVLDVEGRIVKWSAGAERVLGYKEKEILGEYFSRFYRAEDIWHGNHHNALRTVLATGRFEDKGLRLRKDGTDFYAHVTLTPFYNESGALGGFIKLICDRTEYKGLEERLHMSEEKNRKLFDKSVVGYCVLSPDGSIRSANGAFAKMFGFSSNNNAQGTNIADLFPNSTVFQTILQSIYEYKNIPHSEYQLRHKNGETVYVIASVFGQFNDNNELMEIHGSFSDITRQKQLEQRCGQIQGIECSG